MARSAKTTTKAAPAAPAAATRITKARAAEPPAAQLRSRRERPFALACPSLAKLAPERGKIAAASVTAVAPTRVPPPSKGELRAQIEKLETANATLKAKRPRSEPYAAKVAARRIAELEGEVARLQEEAASAVDPAAVMQELEAAKAALQAKGREASRAAKLSERRIAELEAQVGHLQGEAGKNAPPVAQEAEAKRSRRGRPPGRKNAIDPGDAMPRGVAVQEPMDPEAEAARHALEANMSEAQGQKDE